MKISHAIMLLCLFAGCAARKEVRSARPVEVPGTTVADMPAIRTPETVKAYPVGRYTDPNFPNEMHERHTLYRREQAADWNYRPSQPQTLPLGPVAAVSDPSPSYYAATNAEQINAQQKAYAEALLEQNRVMKERIDALQKNESTIQSLQSEVERLKKELDSRKESAPAEADRCYRMIFRSGEPRRNAPRTRFPIPARSFSSPDRTPTARHSSFLKCASTTNWRRRSMPSNGANS